MSAGVTVTTPSATLSGNGRIQISEVMGNAEVANADALYNENMDADNGLPAQVRAGIGWSRPGVGSAGLDVIHHFSGGFNWMEGIQDGEPVTIRQEREAVTDVQVGSEYIVRKRYPVRAGFFTSFSSAPDLDPEETSTPDQVDLYGLTASVVVIGENVVLNLGLSYVFGDGDSFGTRFNDAGGLETRITETSDRSLYAFASTAYRF